MDQLKSKVRIAEQVGAKGYFAEISLTARSEDCDESRISIIFSDTVDAEWREAAAVGLRTGWSCLPSKFKYGKQLEVRVESIQSQPLDTTETVVIFASARALIALFDPSLPGGPEFGAFLFGR